MYPDAQAISQLKDESASYYYSDPARALQIALQARLLAEQIGTPEAHAIGLWTEANARAFLDQWSEAVVLFDQAGALFDRVSDPVDKARMQVGLVYVLAYQGEVERALHIASEIEPVLQQCARRNERDAARLASLINNIGIANDLAGRPDAALSAYDRRLLLVEGQDDLIEIARTQQNRGIALLGLNLDDEALYAFEQARVGLSTAVGTSDDVDRESSEADLARLDLNIAILHMKRRRFPAAAAAFQTAEDRLKRLSHLDTQLLLVELYRAVSLIMSEGGLAVAQGLALLTSRMEQIQAFAPVFEQGMAWLGIARARLLQGELVQARTAGYAALTVAGHAGISAESFAWYTSYTLAQIEYASGDLGRSIDFLQQAVAAIEVLDSDVRVEMLRASFLTDKLDVYHTLARLYAQCGNVWDAWETIQSAKARELTRRLENSSSDNLLRSVRETAPESAMEIERLQQELGKRYRKRRVQMLTSGDVLPIPTLDVDDQKPTAVLEHRLHEALRSAERVAGTTASQVTRRLVDGISDSLSHDSALIEFVWTSAGLDVITMTAGHPPRFQSLGAIATVAALCEQYHAAVERALGIYPTPLRDRLSTGLLRDVESIGLQLFNLVLRPLDLAEVTTLIIAADGPLAQVPFHALPGWDGAPLLINKRVQYVPGAHFLRKPYRHSNRRCVGIAAAQEHAQQARYELEALRKFHPQARLYSHEDISPDLLYEVLLDCDWLHLATHAAFNSVDPMLTSVAIGTRDVTLSELRDLPLNGACVVLSACESLRSWHAGADAFSVGRAFLAAGAATLATSMWRVSDEITATLMRSFYKQLSQGASVVDALRQAQLDWLASASGLARHPALWASLLVMGADQTPVP